jgi:hypothetical protein
VARFDAAVRLCLSVFHSRKTASGGVLLFGKYCQESPSYFERGYLSFSVVVREATGRLLYNLIDNAYTSRTRHLARTMLCPKWRKSSGRRFVKRPLHRKPVRTRSMFLTPQLNVLRRNCQSIAWQKIGDQEGIIALHRCSMKRF